MVKCVREVIKPTYILTLTEEEMVTIYAVLGSVSGRDESPCRLCIKRIWDVLDIHIASENLHYPQIETMTLNERSPLDGKTLTWNGKGELHEC